MNINDLFLTDYEIKEIHEDDKFTIIREFRCIPLNTYKKYLKLAEKKDLIVCRICGGMYKNLISHIRHNHKKITLYDYMNIFNFKKEDCYSKTYLKTLSDNVRGEKNPGYNHGGVLSPFSKKFKKYDGMDESQKDIQLKKIYEKTSNSLKNNKNLPSQPEFWIKKGYSEEESLKKVSESQTTFSKEICINKYGEEEGLKRWEKRQEKWQNTLKSKPQEEIDRINKEKLKGLTGSSHSKISQDLFWNIYKQLDSNMKQQCLFGELNNELFMFNDIAEKRYFIDFTVGDVCIEFNGTYWHADKRFYKKDDVAACGSLAENLWMKDKIKCDYIQENYKLLIVWEYDYENNKEKIINDCLSFIRSNYVR